MPMWTKVADNQRVLWVFVAVGASFIVAVVAAAISASLRQPAHALTVVQLRRHAGVPAERETGDFLQRNTFVFVSMSNLDRRLIIGSKTRKQ